MVRLSRTEGTSLGGVGRAVEGVDTAVAVQAKVVVVVGGNDPVEKPRAQVVGRIGRILTGTQFPVFRRRGGGCRGLEY